MILFEGSVSHKELNSLQINFLLFSRIFIWRWSHRRLYRLLIRRRSYNSNCSDSCNRIRINNCSFRIRINSSFCRIRINSCSFRIRINSSFCRIRINSSSFRIRINSSFDRIRVILRIGNNSSCLGSSPCLRKRRRRFFFRRRKRPSGSNDSSGSIFRSCFFFNAGDYVCCSSGIRIRNSDSCSGVISSIWFSGRSFLRWSQDVDDHTWVC